MQRSARRTECSIFEISCFAGDLESAAAKILVRTTEGSGGYVCQANAHVLVTAQHDGCVRRALDDAWLVCADGSPVAWLERRLGAKHASRIAGADLMVRVFEMGQAQGLRHYLFGSTPDVLAALERALAANHPGAQVVGSFSPPFGRPTDNEARDHVERIKETAPDIVWCGLGAPKQELWMQRHAPELTPAVLVGVGAAFDFHAGNKSRAPLWMQRSGLEWFHRLRSEPRRLAGRYARTNSEFLIRASCEALAGGVLRRRRARATSRG